VTTRTQVLVSLRELRVCLGEPQLAVRLAGTSAFRPAILLQFDNQHAGFILAGIEDFVLTAVHPLCVPSA
jgi:hypothetical protein